jgi:phosphohistidine phosphatase SixA
VLKIRVRGTEVPPPSAGAKVVGHDPTVGQLAAQLSDERRTRRLTEGMVALEVPLALVVRDKRHGEQASPGPGHPQAQH